MVLWCSCMHYSKYPIHFNSLLSFSFLCWLGEGLGGNEIILEALVIRRIFFLVDMITKAEFLSNPNDYKICLFG